jgi:hypothetical protein
MFFKVPGASVELCELRILEAEEGIWDRWDKCQSHFKTDYSEAAQ